MDIQPYVPFISPSRIIRAMRDCRQDHGQGNSSDREAMKYAQELGFLVLDQWSAGYWKITDKGFNFIEAIEDHVQSNALLMHWNDLEQPMMTKIKSQSGTTWNTGFPLMILND
jgi:hypothetical protein